MRELKDIKNINQLIEYLKSKGKNHMNFYHYTNKDGLRGMISSGKLHISRADKMNDKQELTKGNKKTWENLYLSCFNYGEEENMAMWGLYGIPSEEALRITIPGKVMRKWIDNTKKVYGVSSNNNTFEYNELLGVKSIYLADIIYANGNRNVGDISLKRSGEKLEVKKIDPLRFVSSRTEMTGYIKNSAWSYENEVRIRIENKRSIDYNKIAIEIPNEVFENMSILFGPNYDKENDIEDFKLIKTKPKDSDFRGLVNYRDKCEFCISKYIRKHD